MSVNNYNSSSNSRLPQHGVQYPLRIGKSLRKTRRNSSTRPSREIMTIKYNHVPSRININRPGILQTKGSKCNIQLPMEDGTSIHFNGSRKLQNPNSSMDDYVLIYYRGAAWLELVSDTIFGMKPMDMGKQHTAIEYPSMEEDDNPERDPDSWIPTSNYNPESGSPITPEEDMMEETQQPSTKISRVGGKSTPSGSNAPNRKMISNTHISSTNTVEYHQPTATKSVATKGLARKSLTGIPSQASDDDDDDDDESNKDSSSSDDSDESGSDSGDDSGDYTEESSDEE